MQKIKQTNKQKQIKKNTKTKRKTNLNKLMYKVSLDFR